jgi:riboflavin synthase alpha subunit
MMNQSFIFENMSEGHPVYLCDNNTNIFMSVTIGPEKKKSMLPFIESNLGQISQRKIAKSLGIGKTTVNKWSKELGFHHVKHSVNENFFDEWNDDSAYILGYIFADGCVSWNPRRGYQSLTITASEKDSSHIETIRKTISSTKPLLYSEKTKSYRLIANSKKLCMKLMKMGIVPRKSLIVEFPDVPKKYLRHFIRGVIDGDGTVRYVNRKRSPYFEIQISSGSPKFIRKLVETIKGNIGVDSTIRKVSKNTFVTQYSCSRGKRLAEWIYWDAHLFLMRKFQQYKIAQEAKTGGDSAL